MKLIAIILIFILPIYGSELAVPDCSDPVALANDLAHPDVGPVLKSFFNDDPTKKKAVETWELVKRCSSNTKKNRSSLDAIQLGVAGPIEDVGSLTTYAGVSYLPESSIVHIFRGDPAGGGRHHLSVMRNDATIEITNIQPNPIALDQKIMVRMQRKTPSMNLPMPDKTLFPANWTERETIDAIKRAHDSSSLAALSTQTANVIDAVTGLEIRIVKENGVITTAYPR